MAYGPGVEPIPTPFRDPMVAYRSDAKGNPLPLRLDVDRSFWRDFSSMLPVKEGSPPASLAHADEILRTLKEEGEKASRSLRVLGQVSDQAKVLYPFLLYTSPMTVANHLTLNELWRRAKKAKDPIEKDRFLAVYHAKRGLTAKEIARIIPNTPRWVQETVRRYNLEGPEALKDKRHQNPGQKPKLTPEERMRVLEALQGPPPDGGLWTGPKLRDWVERELGKRLSLYPIYRLLHEMGFALRVPRPRHRKADGEAQEALEKTSSPRSRRRGPRGGG
jgi:transposase